jgi:hypothetical protein
LFIKFEKTRTLEAGKERKTSKEIERKGVRKFAKPEKAKIKET